MLTIEPRTVSELRKSAWMPTWASSSTIGLVAGTYRKPHSSDAITPGTPYGRK